MSQSSNWRRQRYYYVHLTPEETKMMCKRTVSLPMMTQLVSDRAKFEINSTHFLLLCNSNTFPFFYTRDSLYKFLLWPLMPIQCSLFSQWALNGLMFVSHLIQCLTQIKCSMSKISNVYCFYYFIYSSWWLYEIESYTCHLVQEVGATPGILI